MELPPNPPTAIARLVAEHAKLTEANRDAAVTLAASIDALTAAEAVDRDAYAAALRAGKADPGTPTTDAARQAVADAERRGAATEQALAQLDIELRAAVAEHASTWARTVAERRSAEVARARAAVDQLAASIHAIGILTGTAAWLDDPARRYKPARFFASQLLPNGEPMPLDAVVAELAAWIADRTDPAAANKVAVAT